MNRLVLLDNITSDMFMTVLLLHSLGNDGSGAIHSMVLRSVLHCCADITCEMAQFEVVFLFLLASTQRSYIVDY